MGCSGSKDAQPKSTNRPPEKRQSPPPQDSESDGYVSVEEACKMLLTELQISEEKAKKVVNKLDRRRTGKIAKAELNALKDEVNTAKKEIVPLFREADPDGDGHVPLDEAAKMLCEKFKFMKVDAMNNMTKRFDVNADGKFNYGEFVLFYSHCKSKQNKFKETLDDLQMDESGSIDAEVVIKALEANCDLEHSEAEALVDQSDKDSNGKLDKKEFEQFWHQLFGEVKEQ